MLAPVLALGMPVGAEWLILAALGLLFFGKRLPEVGRSLGKGILEFKRGLKSVEDDVEGAGQSNQTAPVPQITAQPIASLPQQNPAPAAEQPTGYRFDPYTGKPIEPPAARFDPFTGKPLPAETPMGPSSSAP